MLLFMFILFPVVLAGYCIYYRNTKIVPPVFLGTMSAILLCAFKTFFLYAHRIVPYSVGLNISYLLVRQTLLPALVIYALFLIFSRDDLEFKGESACPLLLSFYMIYLPYSIVSTAEGLYSGYSVFVKPVVFLFMIFFVSFCARKVCKEITNKKWGFVVLFSLAALAYLVIPTIIEAFAIINEMAIIQIIGSLLYCLIPLGIFVFPVVKSITNK